MTDYWYDYDALNIVFDYIVPGLILVTALLSTWILGGRYRSVSDSPQCQKIHTVESCIASCCIQIISLLIASWCSFLPWLPLRPSPVLHAQGPL